MVSENLRLNHNRYQTEQIESAIDCTLLPKDTFFNAQNYWAHTKQAHTKSPSQDTGEQTIKATIIEADVNNRMNHDWSVVTR